MRDLERAPSEEHPPFEPSRMPILRPPAPRANWRFTGIALAALAALALLHVVTTRPVATASHTSPQGAVAGYLAAAGSGSQSRLAAYLAPAQRSRAGQMLNALRRDRVRLISPAVGPTSVQGRSAQVAVALEVCYRTSASQPYDCKLLEHEPLGLPAEIQCRFVDGRWYVSTLLEPQPLGG